MDETKLETCTQCGHLWAPHVLVATMITAQHGGLIFCQERGCDCESTWSINGEPMPYIPDVDEVEALRSMAQSDSQDADTE